MPGDERHPEGRRVRGEAEFAGGESVPDSADGVVLVGVGRLVLGAHPAAVAAVRDPVPGIHRAVGFQDPGVEAGLERLREESPRFVLENPEMPVAEGVHPVGASGDSQRRRGRGRRLDLGGEVLLVAARFERALRCLFAEEPLEGARLRRVPEEP